jgi:uncharacterized protein YndB with AHSA1/START domain
MSKSSKPASPRVAGISDAAVRKATGKGWAGWFTLLDKAGASQMSHKGIVAVLHDRHGVGRWWQQMVTVAYEQARGLREKHQKPDGYEISGNKTVAVPLATLFEAWLDTRIRSRWLSDSRFAIRKATPNKSLRITWVDSATHLDVNFYPKGERRSQVSLNHGKLRSAAQAARMKKYWAGELEKLKALLESRAAKQS